MFPSPLSLLLLGLITPISFHFGSVWGNSRNNSSALPASIYVAHVETPRRQARQEPPANNPAADTTPTASAKEGNETFAYSEPTGVNNGSGVEMEPYNGPKMVVKVGHIGAQGALPNEDKILNISRMQLIEEGILGADLDFE